MYHQFCHQPHQHADKLWVVTALSNAPRYKSRYALYERFQAHVIESGANLMTVELALGDRPFEYTSPDNPAHVQLRTKDELWHKEAALNAGIARLPPDWKYVAWVDADVQFMRPDWVIETVHQLEISPVIQMFQSALDLGPQGEIVNTFESFMYSYRTERENGKGPYYRHWHPGYAWAARREAFDRLGGLIDFAILGAADQHMAHALIGEVHEHVPTGISSAYAKHLEIWQERAEVAVQRNVGYMRGTLLHHWHGKKSDRRYQDRWQVLVQHGYDPDRDIQRDWQGLYSFSHAGRRLRFDLQNYFLQRNEDSIDLG